jgi:hypothetical protein
MYGKPYQWQMAPFSWMDAIKCCSIMGKIIITIIKINIEIMIIQTINFEFENLMYLFTMSLPKETLYREL